MPALAQPSRPRRVALPVLAEQRRTPRRGASPGLGSAAPGAGRGIGYLRLSLTKACQMRCTYCRPAKLRHPKGEPVLTPAELHRLVEHMALRHGVSKVRLTGGDPTARRDLLEIIERVASVPGVRDVAMTTNALTLSRMARAYGAAGLKRVNISLDTLDRERFQQLTGVDALERVLAGIDAALEARLGPIKLNTVVVRGQNERDLPGLVRFAASHGLEARFIELMPMGPLAESWAERYVPEAQMRERLETIASGWEPIPQRHNAARRYRVTLDDGSRTTVGFITPMSCNFCSECNRVRVASDGALYPCLMDRPQGSLLPALRPYDAERLDELLAEGFSEKADEHPHDGHAVMTHIGG